ncbi:unnamed protein product [Rhizoctonia solani]|uniref:Uncharacterized protein n=1 Tax=Rhizoctonia solani TaxID=456999 RepID=A0A8H3AU66_9AGAM|nr:unnamed protein product [Rhizoctonia solani]
MRTALPSTALLLVLATVLIFALVPPLLILAVVVPAATSDELKSAVVDGLREGRSNGKETEEKEEKVRDERRGLHSHNSSVSSVMFYTRGLPCTYT